MSGNIGEGDWITWTDSGQVYRGEVVQKLYGFYRVRLEDVTHAHPDVRAAAKTDPPPGNE
jgi:hypothetical protein